jgi:hypothetical protein
MEEMEATSTEMQTVRAGGGKSSALRTFEAYSNLSPDIQGEALRIFGELGHRAADVAVVAMQNNTEIRRISAMENVMIENIRLKYDMYQRVFAAVFAERKSAIGKHFEVIDKGMRENNMQLILGGLKCLSDIVATSPFANLEQFSAAFDNNALPPI